MKSNTILDKIVEKKRVRLCEKKANKSLRLMEEEAKRDERTSIDFAAALKKPAYISIIAEIKKASPSKGLIRENFDPIQIADVYLQNDIQAMSILTEEDFFQGNDAFLSNVRKKANIPLLRKDFIFDEYQIYEAKLLGADGMLLIAAILDDAELARLQSIAHEVGLQTLIEVHNDEEMSRVLYLPDAPNMLGVNNRDLHTFKEDLHTTERLLTKVNRSDGICFVSESAIRSPEDLAYIEEIGVDAALIGECFMREDDIGAAIHRMRSYSFGGNDATNKN